MQSGAVSFEALSQGTVPHGRERPVRVRAEALRGRRSGGAFERGSFMVDLILLTPSSLQNWWAVMLSHQMMRATHILSPYIDIIVQFIIACCPCLL